MADSPRAVTWERFEPPFSDEETTAANRAGKMVASAAFKPVLVSLDDVGFLAVKMAMEDGTTRTVFLDQFAARVLANTIDSINQLEWKTTALQPKGSSH